MPSKSNGTLRITLVRSPIGREKSQKATVQALGIRKLNETIEREDTPAVRGMLEKISHLVEVEES